MHSATTLVVFLHSWKLFQPRLIPKKLLPNLSAKNALILQNIGQISGHNSGLNTSRDFIAFLVVFSPDLLLKTNKVHATIYLILYIPSIVR